MIHQGTKFNIKFPLENYDEIFFDFFHPRIANLSINLIKKENLLHKYNNC